MYDRDPKHPTLAIYKWQFYEEIVTMSEKQTNRCYGWNLKCLHACALKCRFPLVLLFGRVCNLCIRYVVGSSGSPEEGCSQPQPSCWSWPHSVSWSTMVWKTPPQSLMSPAELFSHASLTQRAKSPQTRMPNTSFLSGVVLFWYLVPVSPEQVVQ